MHEELHWCAPPPSAHDTADNDSRAIKIITYPVSGGDLLIVLNAEVTPYTLVRSIHRAAYRINRVSGGRIMKSRAHRAPWARGATGGTAIGQDSRVHIRTVT